MMLRLIFGALIGLLVAYPALLALLLAAVATVISQPAIIAAAIAIWAWPRIAPTVRGWAT